MTPTTEQLKRAVEEARKKSDEWIDPTTALHPRIREEFHAERLATDAYAARLEEELRQAVAHAHELTDEAAIAANRMRELESALKRLNEIHNLGDAIYSVRDREGKGWDGPIVKEYGDLLAALSNKESQDDLHPATVDRRGDEPGGAPEMNEKQTLADLKSAWEEAQSLTDQHILASTDTQTEEKWCRDAVAEERSRAKAVVKEMEREAKKWRDSDSIGRNVQVRLEARIAALEAALTCKECGGKGRRYDGRMWLECSSCGPLRSQLASGGGSNG